MKTQSSNKLASFTWFSQDIKKGPKIGSGAFGDVFEGLWNPKDGEKQLVVLKQYKDVRGRDVQSFYEDELAACRRVFPLPPIRTTSFDPRNHACPSSSNLGFDEHPSLMTCLTWFCPSCRLIGCDGVADFIGVAGEDVYLVWEYEGTVTLEAIMQSGEGVVALAEVLGYESTAEAFEAFAAGLLGAIMSLHAEGVVHRDIKPGNILLAQTDNGIEVKLIDLGAVADLNNQYLREDEAIFDPLYGAPEQYIEKKG
eukprot:2729309-Pyramimonas_sp.AAC.1